MALTVIGDAVNLASRVESTTKRYGAKLLISEDTFAQLIDPSGFAIRRMERVSVVNRRRPVTLFEVYDEDPPDAARGQTHGAVRVRRGVRPVRRGRGRRGARRVRPLRGLAARRPGGPAAPRPLRRLGARRPGRRARRGPAAEVATPADHRRGSRPRRGGRTAPGRSRARLGRAGATTCWAAPAAAAGIRGGPPPAWAGLPNIQPMPPGKTDGRPNAPGVQNGGWIMLLTSGHRGASVSWMPDSGGAGGRMPKDGVVSVETVATSTGARTWGGPMGTVVAAVGWSGGCS